MSRRLFHYYQRKRIVNINANIIAAGLLALIPTTGVVWLAKLWIPETGGLWIHDGTWEWLDAAARPTGGGGTWLGAAVIFTVLSITCDVMFDVAIYYLLHWVANHWRPLGRTGRTEAETHELSAKAPPFMRDASLIQFERALLSPVYYLTAAGLMQYLQTVQHARPGFAVLIAFPAGLIVTRVAHTLWGLRSGTFLSNAEREAKRKAKAAARAAAGGDEQRAA